MGYALDPEVASVEPPSSLPTELPAVGDWQGLRELSHAWMAWTDTLIAPYPDGYADVAVRTEHVDSADGTTVELRWFTKAGTRPGSAVVFVHGGGMISGTLDLYDAVVARYVQATGVPFLAVDYRIAPEAQGATAAQDALAALGWLHQHAERLGVDARRIGIMGDSAGGGIAAGAAILARNVGVHVAKQVLIYPMLDDRTVVPNAALEPFLTWRYEDNVTGWGALLGRDVASGPVDPVVVPARLDDVAGLPPAYIEVGELDIFREEDIGYAARLMAAGVPLELHVWPGVNHGFDRFAPESAVARTALAARARAVLSV